MWLGMKRPETAIQAVHRTQRKTRKKGWELKEGDAEEACLKRE